MIVDPSALFLAFVAIIVLALVCLDLIFSGR